MKDSLLKISLIDWLIDQRIYSINFVIRQFLSYIRENRMGLIPLILLVLSSMEPSMSTNFLQFSTRLRTSKGAYTANYCACMDTVLLHHPAAWAHMCRIGLIHNIIYTSVLLDQKFHQWQCSKVVTWYRRRHVTNILLCHWW